MDWKLELVEFKVLDNISGSAKTMKQQAMRTVLDPFRFVLIAVAGWMNHRQLQVIEYLREENGVSCVDSSANGGYTSAMTSVAGSLRRRKGWAGGSSQNRYHRYAGDAVGLAPTN